MTDVAQPGGRFQVGESRVGHVLSLAWSVFSRNVLSFIPVTGIASLPSLLMPQPSRIAPFENAGLAVFAMSLMFVLGMLSTAIVLYGAFQVMRGRSIDLAESARIGL